MRKHVIYTCKGQRNLKTKPLQIADHIFSWKTDLKYVHNVLAYQP